MIDTKLRASVQPVFDLLGKGLATTGLTPNDITVMAFITGLSAAVATGFGQIIPALILLWLSGLLDVLDGTVARLTKGSSNLGAYLDLIFDRAVEGAMLIGFYAWKPEIVWPILIFYVGAMFNFTTFLVAATLFKNEGNKSMHYDFGLLERTETFILFTLLLILPAIGFWLLMTFNLLMILTGILRLRKVILWQLNQE